MLIVCPTQSHSLPAPHHGQEAALQRSMSPGGFDAFTLTAEYPSLHMLSPESAQTPLFGRHPPQSGQQQQHQLSGSFEGLPGLPGQQQQPGQGPSSGQAQQSSRGVSSFFGLPPLQGAASPAGEIKTPPEREHARMSPTLSSAKVCSQVPPYE